MANNLSHQNYENQHTENKNLNNSNNRILKVKNSFLEFEKDFRELKDR